MEKNRNVLVVGGDSLVGGQLYNYLINEGYLVSRTTRRQRTAGENWVYFDFSKPETYKNANEFSQVFVVAAFTNYERCATDPMATPFWFKLEKILLRNTTSFSSGICSRTSSA